MSTSSQVLPELGVLASEQTVTDQRGQAAEVNSQIPSEFAATLYEQISARRPQLVVEVGMAFGVSSLAILSALEEVGEGRLISIDPFQSTQWRGCGVARVKKAGLDHRHTLLELPDYLALPQLVEAEAKVDFGYIDGWHTFDYAMLDFWYLDKMLSVGGVIAFNDCAMPAVRKAIKFAKSHRHYREVTPPQRPTTSWKYALKRFLKQATSGGCYEDRYLQKQEAWEPDWNFYRTF